MLLQYVFLSMLMFFSHIEASFINTAYSWCSAAITSFIIQVQDIVEEGHVAAPQEEGMPGSLNSYLEVAVASEQPIQHVHAPTQNNRIYISIPNDYAYPDTSAIIAPYRDRRLDGLNAHQITCFGDNNQSMKLFSIIPVAKQLIRIYQR